MITTDNTWIFPNSIVRHSRLGNGLVSHHEKVKDVIVTFVMWDNGEISVAPPNTVLVEKSKPSRPLPVLQEWVELKSDN